MATINKAHDLAVMRPPGRDPDVADTMAGIRRTRATPPSRKTSVLLADLEAMVAGIEVGEWPSAPGGIRNRCLLVMGWVGAFRRSELAALTVGDVTVHPEDGLHVMVRVSKTDRAGEGRTYALPYASRPALCAPCALSRPSARVAVTSRKLGRRRRGVARRDWCSLCLVSFWSRHFGFRQRANEAGGATGPQEPVEESRVPTPMILGTSSDPTLRLVSRTRALGHIGVLVLTMFHEDENVFQAMRAGARGYLLKGADQAEIARAIRAVAAGDAIFGPALARRLIGYFAAGRGSALPFAGLTEREREVLELVAQGCNNPDIARRLYLSPKTVRNHVSNVFAKLQVTNRAQAIIRAREAGLGDTAPHPRSRSRYWPAIDP